MRMQLGAGLGSMHLQRLNSHCHAGHFSHSRSVILQHAFCRLLARFPQSLCACPGKCASTNPNHAKAAAPLSLGTVSIVSVLAATAFMMGAGAVYRFRVLGERGLDVIPLRGCVGGLHFDPKGP